ncbi:hypothetical protein ACHAXR_011578 [Thalassiosira sp. AJA248-18]
MSAQLIICGDTDAAMSLCAMGHPFLLEQSNKKRPNEPILSSPLKNDPHIVEDDQSRSSHGSPARQHRTKGKLPPKKRAFEKLKESRREPKVSFEEMKRLMRVYGPTKCLRNRTPKESGKSTKMLSVKRKFYRWFPDFHERFVFQPAGGWYKPKIGHEEEMTYREDLRRQDQEILASKRVTTKKNSKAELAITT